MNRQIRKSVFETNSSSTHALAVVTNEKYEQWKEGKLAARAINETESNEPCGNFWSYCYEMEFCPIEEKDERNIEILKENYAYILDPSNNFKPYNSPDKVIEKYKKGKFSYTGIWLFSDYKKFERNGFNSESEYIEHFAHDVQNGLKVFGIYYHD